MLTNSAVERYASALFELAQEEEELDQFDNELNEIYKILRNNPELEKVLYHPRIQASDKKIIMKKILTKEFSPLIINFMMLIIDKGREILLKEIIRYFQNLALEARGIIQIQVYTAMELTSKIETKLAEKLQKLTQKEVELKITVDPSLIGGIKLRIGDKIIDGTILQHLERMRENLAQIQVSQLEVS